MARTTPISMSAACSMAVVRTEAAIEISSFCGVSAGRICLHHLGNRDRLKPDQDQIRCLRGGHIVSRYIDPPLRGELPGALLVFHRSHNLLRLKYLGLEERLEQNSAHFPGSQNGYLEAGKRLPGCVSAHEVSLTYFCVFCCAIQLSIALLQGIEGQRAGIKHLVVEGAEIESVAQRLLRLGPQLQQLELPYLVAERLRRPRDVAIYFGLYIGLARQPSADESSRPFAPASSAANGRRYRPPGGRRARCRLPAGQGRCRDPGRSRHPCPAARRKGPTLRCKRCSRCICETRERR